MVTHVGIAYKKGNTLSQNTCKPTSTYTTRQLETRNYLHDIEIVNGILLW